MISVPRRPLSTTRVGATSRSPTPAWAGGATNMRVGAISASLAKRPNDRRAMNNPPKWSGGELLQNGYHPANHHWKRHKKRAADRSAAPSLSPLGWPSGFHLAVINIGR